MVYPPPTQATNQTNSTVSSTLHPNYHKNNGEAINDIVANRKARRRQSTVGSVAVSTNGFETFDAANTNMVIAAQVGDLIEVTFNIYVGTGTSPPEFRPRFNGSNRYFPASFARAPANWLGAISATWSEVVASGDITSGNVTVGVMWNNPTSSTVHATAANPATFWTKNLGPVL